MLPGFTPLDAMRFMVASGMMMAEAQSVILMRLWGMAGFWNTAPSEMVRMITEKQAAALSSARATQRAMIQGKPAGEVAMAALRPVRSRTRKNAARLSRRGPGAGPA